jgi:hypothetical protein
LRWWLLQEVADNSKISLQGCEKAFPVPGTGSIAFNINSKANAVTHFVFSIVDDLDVVVIHDRFLLVVNSGLSFVLESLSHVSWLWSTSIFKKDEVFFMTRTSPF